jgi:hypothetical protein
MNPEGVPAPGLLPVNGVLFRFVLIDQRLRQWQIQRQIDQGEVGLKSAATRVSP